MTPPSNLRPSFSPSSPDNWLGGTGNWSNGADWSAGEPGSSSDVVIDTGAVVRRKKPAKSAD